MRRWTALVVALVLVVGACSGDDDDESAPTTSTTSTTMPDAGTTTTSTTVPVIESLAVSDECPGIGELAGDAEISWVRNGRIWTAAPDGSGERCIAEYTGRPALQWGGAADRLLAGGRSIVVDSGPLEIVPDDLIAVAWSRPSGKALLARDDEGALSKLSLIGEEPLELGLPFTEGDVLYHPAGTAIALVSTTSDSLAPPDLLLATNRGENVRWLVTNETADAIDELVFSASGAAVFTARHGVGSHVHRLVLGSDTLETLLDTTGVVSRVVASAYDEELIAVGRVGCNDGTSQAMWLHDTSTTGDVSATDASQGQPVGWLPDGGLVVLVHPDGCDDQPGDVYVVRDGTASLVAEGVEAAAVRAQLPPPPPPPPEIEAAPA